jgi:beta-galactosidase
MASSRRQFLRTAARTISLSWGGIHILAGPTAAPSAGQAGQLPRLTQPFIYGSAFYRPPNPPRSQRRAMLKTFAQEYKFNILRIYASWGYYNPEPGRFDFEELEEVMDYCDEFGLRVLMGVITEGAPYWFEAAHPETRYLDARDLPHRLGGSGNNISGGWPGLCLDWEPVREAGGRYIREMAKVVGAHPSMYAYDVWNEPHLEGSWSHRFTAKVDESLFCYCPRTIAEFQHWLERRYGSIGRLNEAWVRKYSDWKLIDPPRLKGTYLDWVDWRRFIIERSTDEMRFRADNVRASDSQHLLESHAGRQAAVEPIALMGNNSWRLAEVVEVWGLSMFPRWDAAPPYIGAAKLEITRCNAGQKPFWMTELQGGHASNGLWRSPNMRPRDIRLWNWMAVASGAKGLLYWAYHTEATGLESTGFGLVERDSSPSERALEAAEDNRLIQAHWDVIKDYRPKPEVAILFDQDNALLTFAMSAEESSSTDSFRGYYKALWTSDLWADFIEPSSLDGAKYKVIIVPWHLIGKADTCRLLQRFVETGGTLILETAFGLYDERCFNNPVGPPYGLAEAFGFREKESYFLKVGTESRPLMVPRDLPASERIYYEPEIEFSEPAPVRVKGHTFLTPIEISSASCIAKCQALPVAAMKKLGKGQVYYFGTNLGASIEAGDKGGIELVRTIVTRVVQPRVTADKVRPRLIEGPTRSLLVVFNDTVQDQTASVKLPARYHRATDLYGKQEVTIQGSTVRINVPFEGVSVLRLE